MDDSWSRKRSSGKEDKVDSVMWDYLDATIDHMGFGSAWRKLIYERLSAAKTAILINGSPSPEFSLQRGLRQGDPLSTFLFDIEVEGLSVLFQRTSDVGYFKGL
jgi:hypothetical protein